MSRRLRHTFLFIALLLVGVGTAVPAAASPVAPRPKAIVLTATPATTGFGQATRLALSLTPRSGGQPKGGTITFATGDQVLGTVEATRRISTLSTRALPVGEHVVTAAYSGDSVIGEATSNPVTVTVTPGRTTTTLTGATTAVVGATSEIKAVVRAVGSNTRPAGTVSFSTGSGTATVRVNTTGVATWRPTLAEGTHEVTATFSGNESYGPSTSSPFTRTIGPAVATIDQSNPGPGTGTLSAVRTGQIFTAGRTGQLEKVRISTSSSGEQVTVQILAVEDWATTSTVLGSASTTTTGGPVDVVLDVPVAVTAGTRYTLALTSTAPAPTYDTTSQTYSLGSTLLWIMGRFYLSGSDVDLVFTTWVR